MIRKEAVLCGLLRPATGAQSEKTDERTGTGGQHGGGHPGHRDTCIRAVIELQAPETPVESAGRSLDQGPAPEAKRRSAQDLLACCRGPFGPGGEELDDLAKGRSVVLAIGEGVRPDLVQKPEPRLFIGERSIRGEDAGPIVWKRAEQAGLVSYQRRQATDTVLG